jgi:prepilin-type N-terminal cleavage/methylation domain-containing protein
MVRKIKKRGEGEMKKDFTLIEIVIALIILGILVTFGIPLYNNLIENAKAKVCETNQKVLLGAIESYGLEHDRLPASLSDLKKEHLRRAWAKIFKKEKNPLLLRLAYFLVDFDQRGLVYAKGGWIKRYIGELKYFICPKDETPPPSGYSYGIYRDVANISWEEYKDLPANTIVIADSDTPVFDYPVSRHKKYLLAGGSKNYYVGIIKGHYTIKKYSPRAASPRPASPFSSGTSEISSHGEQGSSYGGQDSSHGEQDSSYGGQGSSGSSSGTSEGNTDGDSERNDDCCKCKWYKFRTWGCCIFGDAC